MKHEMQPDSLVDLKFIMADTGFQQASSINESKQETWQKAGLYTVEQDGYLASTAISKKAPFPLRWVK
jgi:hypothetical protein